MQSGGGGIWLNGGSAFTGLVLLIQETMLYCFNCHPSMGAVNRLTGLLSCLLDHHLPQLI